VSIKHFYNTKNWTPTTILQEMLNRVITRYSTLQLTSVYRCYI